MLFYWSLRLSDILQVWRRSESTRTVKQTKTNGCFIRNDLIWIKREEQKRPASVWHVLYLCDVINVLANWSGSTWFFKRNWDWLRWNGLFVLLIKKLNIIIKMSQYIKECTATQNHWNIWDFINAFMFNVQWGGFGCSGTEVPNR